MPLPQYGRGFFYVCIMTLDEYKEKVTDEILYRMAKELGEHDRDFTPSSITEEFWLVDLRNSLVPGDCRERPYKVQIRGYALEIWIEGGWPIVLYYRQGKILIGKYFIKTDCLERAEEDLRFMITLIPKYSDEYKTAIANAAMEMQKEKMVQEIYEATVAPTISELLKGRGLTCETRRNSKTVTLNLRESKCRIKTFYISYDNFQNELEEIKSFITKRYPLKTEAELAVIASN